MLKRYIFNATEVAHQSCIIVASSEAEAREILDSGCNDWETWDYTNWEMKDTVGIGDATLDDIAYYKMNYKPTPPLITHPTLLTNNQPKK